MLLSDASLGRRGEKGAQTEAMLERRSVSNRTQNHSYLYRFAGRFFKHFLPGMENGIARGLWRASALGMHPKVIRKSDLVRFDC